MKNVARVDPKTNQLMYNPTYDELYIPKVFCVCAHVLYCVVTMLYTSSTNDLCIYKYINLCGLATGWA